MGVFHNFQIIQMVPNRGKCLIKLLLNFSHFWEKLVERGDNLADVVSFTYFFYMKNFFKYFRSLVISRTNENGWCMFLFFSRDGYANNRQVMMYLFTVILQCWSLENFGKHSVKYLWWSSYVIKLQVIVLQRY